MDDFGPNERERLLARFGKTFSAGEVIYTEGDFGTEAYLLQEGRVRLIKRVRTVERTLMVLRPGDLFGESAFVPGASRSSTAVALSDVIALALDRDTFAHLLQNNGSVAARIVQQMARRLRHAEDQIEIMMLGDTQSKIVSALLKMAQQLETDDRGGVVVQISPMELSTRVGMEVDAVKRGVQRLRDGQYLRVIDEKLDIPDVGALQKLFLMLGIKDELRDSDAPAAPATFVVESGRPQS